MGEVTALRGIGLTYNGRGQVQSLTRPSGSVVETELYGYDTAGRRIARTRSVPNGSATTYEAHELYVYEGANLAALYSGATNAPPLADTWLYDGVDHPLRVNVRSAPQSLVYYYELDLAGNVRRLMRPGGSDAGGYRYTAFGTQMPADAKTLAAQIDQPLRWKGRFFSDFVPGAGIYDVRARAWSPEMGSFTSIDEYAFHDAKSTLWGWPGENPIRWRDPSGRTRANVYVGLFTSDQIASAFQLSADYAMASTNAWNAGNYFSAYADFAVSANLNEAGLLASLLRKRPATGADLAMMACPVEAPGEALASGLERGPTTTRFVSGVEVKSFGSTVATGTVDLGTTIEGIQSGSLSPRDVFLNREGLLPAQPEGYYHEYTVPTPGLPGPGPQRIVAGNGGELYYTPDHYGSFVPLTE